jgi:hypothetical protein
MRPNVYLFIVRTCQGFRGNQDHHDKASFRAACDDRAYSDAADRLGIARAERAADRGPERRTWSRRKAQATPGAARGCTPGATRAAGCRTSSATATRAAAAATRSGSATARTSATSGGGSAAQAYTSAPSGRCTAAAYASASAAPGRSTVAAHTSAAPGRRTVAAYTSATSGCGTPAPAYTSVGSAPACSGATWSAEVIGTAERSTSCAA